MLTIHVDTSQRNDNHLHSVECDELQSAINRIAATVRCKIRHAPLTKGIPFTSEGYKPTIQPEYNQQQCEDEKAAQERLFAACDAHLALSVHASSTNTNVLVSVRDFDFVREKHQYCKSAAVSCNK